MLHKLSNMSPNMSTFKGQGGICWMTISCRVWNPRFTNDLYYVYI